LFLKYFDGSNPRLSQRCDRPTITAKQNDRPIKALRSRYPQSLGVRVRTLGA
jgi:hypothetical protein